MKIITVPNSPISNSNNEVNYEWRVFFTQMVQQLQTYLSDEAYILPQKSTTNVEAMNIVQRLGGILYNSDTNSPMVNLKSDSGAGPTTTYTFVNLATVDTSLTDAEVGALNSDSREGRFFITSDTHELKIWINGVLRTVTVT